MKKITLLICDLKPTKLSWNLLALLSIFFFLSLDTNAQGWERTYGGSNNELSKCVRQTGDGGYIILGKASSVGKWMNDIYIIKTNEIGDTLWTKRYGGIYDDVGYNILQNSDGGYIIFGTTCIDSSSYESKIYLIKTNITGDTIWTKTLEPPYNIAECTMQQTSDGGYIILLLQNSNTTIHVIKTDKNGNILWKKDDYYIDWGGVAANSIYQTNDGGYIIGGAEYLIQTNSIGDTLWTKKIKNYLLQPTKDGGYISVDNPRYNFYPYDIYLTKTDKNGNLLWKKLLDSKTLNKINYISWIQQTEDDGYIISGGISYYDTTKNSIYNGLIKTDAYGNETWRKIIGTKFRNSNIFFVKQTIDKGYITTGTFQKQWGNMEIFLIKTDSLGNIITNLISGQVFNDVNNNCKKDSGEKALKNRIIRITPWQQYATIDSNGYYSVLVDSGTYTVSIADTPKYRKNVCPVSSNSYSVHFAANNYDTSATNDFGSIPSIYCPLMWVDISTSFLRLGRQNVYSVNYCNKGTVDATNSYINIEFDKNIIPLSSTLAWSAKQGNTYTFNLGTVKEGECGSFYITDSVSRYVKMGSTLCTKAKIYPDTICTATDSSWDKSSISLTRACMNDSIVRFVIYNTGESMTGTSEYRIYTNNGLSLTKKFQLVSGDSLIVDIIANGNTIRLEADQRTGHPGNSHPSETVEGCGHNYAASRMIGLVNSVPQDDADEFVAMDCQTVRASYDPNEKLVVPTGITANNYISAKNELEYQIGFQNTGNDTAFLVVVRDTLPASLEVTSVVSGSSSHPYSFRIYGQGILEWTFKNILLVDSTTNEPKSHGFVKYRIKQKTNNPKGTVIANRAAIYFDYNTPVITNAATNTVYDTTFVNTKDTIIILGNTNTKTFTAEANISIYPNPTSNVFTLAVETTSKEDVTIKVYNLLGETVYTASEKVSGKYSKEINLHRPSGIYFVQVQCGERAYYRKLVVQ